MSDYFLFLLIFFAIPLALILFLTKGRVFRYKRTILWSLAWVYTIGWFWDWLSVQNGIWRYDTGKTFGVWISGLPVEEFIGFYILGPLLIIAVIDLFAGTSMRNAANASARRTHNTP